VGLLQLAGGGTFEELKARLMGSIEYYFDRGGFTDGGFLNAVYLDALNRPLDVSGVVYYGGLLTSRTMTREATALLIEELPDAAALVVANDYHVLLHRDAGGGIAYFVNQIASGLRDEDVVAQLAASREYYNNAHQP